MDANIEFSTIIAICGAIATIGGAWLTVRKINKDFKKDRELEAAKILQDAKEAISKLEHQWKAKSEILYNELDGKIDDVSKDVQNLRDNVDKDLQHLRETYNGEIRNLGQKIEDLRSEIRNQHSQMVGLLTKMIDARD